MAAERRDIVCVEGRRESVGERNERMSARVRGDKRRWQTGA